MQINPYLPLTPKTGPSATPSKDSVESEAYTQVFEYDTYGLPNPSDISLKGSFNPQTGLYDANWNAGRTIPMHDDGLNGDLTAGDGVYSASVQLQPWQKNTFTWGVEGKIDGRPLDWMIFQEKAPEFKLWESFQRVYYAPVTTHRYGVHKGDQGQANFRTWAPNMDVQGGPNQGYRLCVDFFGSNGQLEASVPMEKDATRGDWTLTLPSFEALKDKSYRYTARSEKGEILKDSKGNQVSYADPYSRFLQGQQRGVERIYVEPVFGFETGWYDDSGSGGPNYQDNPQWGRFSVDGYRDADKVKLVLRDDQGRQLTKAQLIERLGEPKFKKLEEATPDERRDVEVLTRWTMNKTKPIGDLNWIERVSEDGSINLKRIENGKVGTNWSVAVNGFPQMVGLNYEFQIEKAGELVGDVNGDRILQPQELQNTPFNDPYSNVISAHPGSARNSLVKESSFQPRFHDTPRKETDHRKMVIYELHLGSFMGSKDNTLPATAEDLLKNLDYLDKLNVNTLEFMPTSEFGGKRDWGYTPDHYFAGADAYAFTMDRQQALSEGLISPDQHEGQERVYINGTDAIRYVVDQAHKRGFNVIGDVVYNHTSGRPDGDNPLWKVDGDAQSYFKWFGEGVSNTPWGAKPNFAAQGVKDFFSNHSVDQVEYFGFDGLRYDFAQVLHSTGSAAEQVEGMNALRQINRTLKSIDPKTYTTAEDFTRNWLVAADLDQSQWQDGIEKKGMGFNSVWTDRFRLDAFGVAEGHANVDQLMEALTSHVGVSGFDRAVVYAHSHDEVGNSGKWMQRGAAGSKEDDAVFQAKPRAITRSISALTLLGAGVPMIWQGEEFLANNDFKHGLTATWGHDTDWIDFGINPAELQQFRQLQQSGQKPSDPVQQAKFDKFLQVESSSAERMSARQGHFQCYADLIKLRSSSAAFDSTSEASRLYTHNGDKVLSLKRSGEGQEFVVVTNFGDHNRGSYDAGLPAGKWQEVFNSDSQSYGGSNFGNAGQVLTIDSNHRGVNLPAGGTVVFRKV